jgi:hypothetical protein
MTWFLQEFRIRDILVRIRILVLLLSSKIKSHYEVTKQQKERFLIMFLLVDGRIRINNYGSTDREHKILAPIRSFQISCGSYKETHHWKGEVNCLFIHFCSDILIVKCSGLKIMLTFWNGLIPVELLCDATPEFVRMIDAFPSKELEQNSY